MTTKNLVRDIAIWIGIVLGTVSIFGGISLFMYEIDKPCREAYYYHLKRVSQLQQEGIALTKKSHFLTPSQKDQILTVGSSLYGYVNDTDDPIINLDFSNLSMLEDGYSRCLKEVKESSTFVSSCSADHFIPTIERIKFPPDEISFREDSERSNEEEDDSPDESHPVVEEGHSFSVGHAAE
ncbi:MAG: hypothetical protein J6S85_15175 [Methanobrevibacter sp.]|nr:hypothetical protein [Methanobrevibacter sp.]